MLGWMDPKKISKIITEIHTTKYPKIHKFPNFFVKKMTQKIC